MAGERKPFAMLQTPFDETAGQFSPEAIDDVASQRMIQCQTIAVDADPLHERLRRCGVGCRRLLGLCGQNADESGHQECLYDQVTYGYSPEAPPELNNQFADREPVSAMVGSIR